MNAPANIFSVVVLDLKPKIRKFIDKLNGDGQIDLDDNGHPYLLKVDQQGANHVCHIVRNSRQENFIINTRKQADPIQSWDAMDGYHRVGGKKVIIVQTDGDKPKGERAKRRSFESFRRLAKQIIEG
jgi:hypothetical protein